MIVVRVVNYQVLELSARSFLGIEDVVRGNEIRGHEFSAAAFQIRSLFVATKEIVEELTNVLRIADTDHESELEKAVQVMFHELHLRVEKMRDLLDRVHDSADDLATLVEVAQQDT